LRNQSAFVDVFAVKPGDAMYLPPEQRISLWQMEREVKCREKPR
jgi:putative endopeptidase